MHFSSNEFRVIANGFLSVEAYACSCANGRAFLENTIMYRYTKLSLAAVALATLGTLAYAGQHGENDAMAAAKSKISLTQAVAIAEKQASGKATQAEFEREKQGNLYKVEVVGDAKVFDVKVNADTGAVISSVQDKED